MRITKLCRWLLLSGCTLVVACDATQQVQPPQSPAQAVPKGVLPPDLQPQEVPFQQLVGSLPKVSHHWLGQPEDPDLLVLSITPEAYQPQLIAYPAQGISAQDAMQQHQLQILVGSGFVSNAHSLEPVGLLQVEGHTLSAIQAHGYTRILGLSGNGIGVVHRQHYEQNIFHSALQAGPGIIENGLLDISERDLQRPAYFRSFVGLCSGRWLVGISLKPTHLHTLGKQLLSFTEAQRWQCSEVVNLAGDRQAVLMIRTTNNNLLYHGDPHTYKVSLLGFKPNP